MSQHLNTTEQEAKRLNLAPKTLANNPLRVSPEAAEFLIIMKEEIRLPKDWDVSGFWLDSAQNLAQLLADYRGKMSLEDASMLTGIGGMLIEMAKREREASAAVGDFLRGKGGDA